MRKTDLFRRDFRPRVHREGSLGYLSTCDALVFLQGLKDEVADIVFLDPPFNLGKDYGLKAGLEGLTPDAYRDYMKLVLLEACQFSNGADRTLLPHFVRRRHLQATSIKLISTGSPSR